MIQTSTSQLNDVVRYLYGETTSTENKEIEKDLCNDEHLLDFYLDSLKIQKTIDRISIKPSKSRIDNIMSFSRNYKAAI